MLIKVANDFAVDPETVDAVKASEVDGVSLVWFNGQDFPYRANADFETVTLRLERKIPAFGEEILEYVLDILGISS